MPNPNKAKGSAWERAVSVYLNDNGFKVQRKLATGGPDQGDLEGLPHWAVECKDHARPAWWDFVRQANVEAKNASKPWGVAVVKKRQAPTAQALVVMDLDTWVSVLKHMERLANEPDGPCVNCLE